MAQLRPVHPRYKQYEFARERHHRDTEGHYAPDALNVGIVALAMKAGAKDIELRAAE